MVSKFLFRHSKSQSWEAWILCHTLNSSCRSFVWNSLIYFSLLFSNFDCSVSSAVDVVASYLCLSVLPNCLMLSVARLAARTKTASQQSNVLPDPLVIRPSSNNCKYNVYHQHSVQENYKLLKWGVSHPTNHKLSSLVSVSVFGKQCACVSLIRIRTHQNLSLSIHRFVQENKGLYMW